MRRLRAIALLLTGCYQPSPPLGAPCDETLPCPSGQSCIAGTCGGATIVDAPEIDDAAPPDACEIARCIGDELHQCDVAPIQCEAGCVGVEKAHCAQLRPSNGFTAADLIGATGALELASTSYTFDTTSGILSGPGGGVPLPAGVSTRLAGSYRLLAAGSFHLPANATLRVRGNKALVILVATAIVLDPGSVIDLSGGCGAGDPSCPGPGGSGGATGFGAAIGCGAGANGLKGAIGGSEAGGGGGGFGTPGAFSAGVGAGQGVGGVACGASMLEPLHGGFGGGSGGIDGAERRGGRGGGGGGALQLTALGSIAIAGTINAGGGGGESGHILDAINGGGGGGGGSGGAVLVEALHVAITGTLAANGGGGGGNQPDDTGRGESGRANATPASGGQPGDDSAGGTGGSALAVPSSGGNDSDRGGGGGAVGRIRVSGPDRVVNGTISPAPVTDGGVLE